MTKKQGISLCVFLSLCAAMLLGLSWLLRDRETSLSSLYSEPENSVDVLIVGSSHVNSGYIPAVLWQEYGISAHNVYSWSQPMWISYHYIREALKTQSPGVVVLDLNGMMYGNSVEQPDATDSVNYANSFTIDPGANFLEMIATVAHCGVDLRDPIDFLPLIRYHSRWKNLDEHAFTYDPHHDHSALKGYGFQVVQHANIQPVFPSLDSAQPYSAAVEYLDRIVALSEREQFDLVFVLAPYVYQENEPAIFAWLADYADAHGIPLLNYCLQDSQRIGLDWSTDFCDASHVNYVGALKLTRDLGDHLTAGDYGLRSASALPNSEQLDHDAACVYRIMDLWEATQGGPDEFLQWVRETGGTLAIAAGGVAYMTDPAALDLLQQFGFENITCVSTPETSYAAILENGIVTEKIDPDGTQAACSDRSGTLSVTSTGAVTYGASVQYGELEAEHSANILIYYYDNILDRPVYRIDIDRNGAFVYTEIV